MAAHAQSDYPNIRTSVSTPSPAVSKILNLSLKLCKIIYIFMEALQHYGDAKGVRSSCRQVWEELVQFKTRNVQAMADMLMLSMSLTSRKLLSYTTINCNVTPTPEFDPELESQRYSLHFGKLWIKIVTRDPHVAWRYIELLTGSATLFASQLDREVLEPIILELSWETQSHRLSKDTKLAGKQHITLDETLFSLSARTFWASDYRGTRNARTINATMVVILSNGIWSISSPSWVQNELAAGFCM
jgi:hypothetical protein